MRDKLVQKLQMSCEVKFEVKCAKMVAGNGFCCRGGRDVGVAAAACTTGDLEEVITLVTLWATVHQQQQ